MNSKVLADLMLNLTANIVHVLSINKLKQPGIKMKAVSRSLIFGTMFLILCPLTTAEDHQQDVNNVCGKYLT